MAQTIKRAAGAAFKLGFKLDGDGATETKFGYTDLTLGAGPRLIDARASADLADPKIWWGTDGPITFKTTDYEFITWVNTAHNGCYGTLQLYSEFNATETLVTDVVYHGLLTCTSSYPLNGPVEMSCTLTPDTMPTNLYDTGEMGFLSS